MHVRIVRGAVRSAVLAAAVTGTLTWAPAATAQSPEPEPSATTTPGETAAPATGSVTLTKKDPAGDLLAGASFLILDTVGQEAGRGTTDARGKLTFPGLAPGVYRLKETASGSRLYDVVADQDVIVTPGATARLTITDPFKPAQVLLKANDDKSGKLLPGSTVNIGTGDTTLLTLTTGPKGTATGRLPLSSRETEFWVRQIKAPAGYDLYKPSKTFTAGPGATATVTVANTKTATKPDPTDKPTDKPTNTPSTPADTPLDGTSGVGAKPTPVASGTPGDSTTTVPVVDATSDETAPNDSAGSLAHTGADATPWILGGAALLLAGGIGAVTAARRRTDTEPEPEPEPEPDETTSAD
ncbi:collagen binding domain-containing protein [Streptomyces sp. NPDC087851]|uniref:MSCRAMM family protein n=1 Tax=Streptomyces sp. NPDC087851 TaxID=3365810 RepID=UPI00380F2ED4